MESLSMNFRSDLTPKDIEKLKKMIVGAQGEDDMMPVLSEPSCSDSLMEKIKLEAKGRQDDKKRMISSTNEDMERLATLLQENMTHHSSSGRDFLSFTGYNKVRSLVPDPLKGILTNDLFRKLINRKDRMERVEGRRIINYVHKKVVTRYHILQLSSYVRNDLPYLTYEDFSEFLSCEIIPNIPAVNESSNGTMPRLDSQYYTCMVEKRVQFLLDPLHTNKIKIVDLLAVGIMDDLISQYDKERQEDEDNKFSVYSCEIVLALFRALDVDQSGLLSIEELSEYDDGKYSIYFIESIFLTEKTYDEGHIDFSGFVNFYNAVEEKKLEQSIRWIFRVIDRNGLGYITRQDILYNIISVMKIVQYKMPHLQANVEDVCDEVFDMSKPIDPTRITLKDILSCGKGSTVIGMIINLDDYVSYETREDQSADPDQE